MARQMVQEEEDTEFKDDFEDEFQDDKPKKPQTKPMKFEKDEYDEDEEEERSSKPRGRPAGSFKKPQNINPNEESANPRYSVYHQPQRDGIKDNKNNLPVGEDILDLICSIKNDLHELKIGLLGEK